MNFRPSPRLKRIAILASLGVVLGATFLAYLRPDFIFDVANRIVLCF
ncbi:MULTISPECIES: hypothetical protein [unclassified Herbaspirillum]|jgi:hypothetical protein|nr:MULTISPECIES: hypothetical protein [unclassified Herbaspirillum]